MALKVQDQSPEVAAMAAHWPIVESLLGGTAAMRAAGKAYLPQWPNEDRESYEARLATATLFPALARTISVMAGKPFSKQAVLSEETPDIIEELCENVDQQGNSYHTQLAEAFYESLAYGICGILTDYSRKPPEVKTQAEEKALGLRPYTVFIRHHQILGWKKEMRDGAVVLTQLRIRECKEVPDGEFGVKEEPRVRVLEPGVWRVYMPGPKPDDDWTLEEGGVTTLNAIPFTPFYGKKLGFMCGISPLLELAYLNVKHWQSQSDQDTILHVARVPILALIGAESPIPDGQGGYTGGTKLTVGAKSAISLPKDGDAKFVEHTGAAINAGQASLEALEAQMVTTGAELLVAKPGDPKSATQSNNEAEANKSDLLRMVEAAEDSADQVLQFMADWIKEPDGGNVSLFKEFGGVPMSGTEVSGIISAQQAGLISKSTAISELKRRGILSNEIDWGIEQELMNVEGPALGTMGEDDDIDPATGLPKKKDPANPDDQEA